jgi:hypothetical protein
MGEAMTDHACWMLWHLCVFFLGLFIAAAMPSAPPAALTINVVILLVVTVGGLIARARQQ